jgi:C-3',4' desaturase CrtD
MKSKRSQFDMIVIGAGMGGLTAASLLANDGFEVLVLEASNVVGGCSSSFYRKGYIFESGATTLVGFDLHQPLRLLEQKLNLEIPKTALRPSMQVHQDGMTITRWQDRQKWIHESTRHFGQPYEQKVFWELALKIADIVWRISTQNPFFPPIEASDWLQLLKNDPRDLWVLPYSLKSVKNTAMEIGISNPDFYRFLDQQLIISAQSKSDETPFLFGAPAITYTNSTNYYIPGGLIQMAECLQNFIRQRGSILHTKEKVEQLSKDGEGYTVYTSDKKNYYAPVIISNIPVWNMKEITHGDMQKYFKSQSANYDKAWGAFTVGVVTDDNYAKSMPLHHQVLLPDDMMIRGIDSGSIFVSFSQRGDTIRAPRGKRVINVSTHTDTDFWFHLGEQYDSVKKSVQSQILQLLRSKLPGFNQAEINIAFSATPITWRNWVHRNKGRVGGIPQSMNRSLIDWTPNQTPFSGLFLCGDTVFPGQGIPGVTLSGFNAYKRVIKSL